MSNRTVSYEYDPVGNRVQLRDTGGSSSVTTYAYDAANRLLSAVSDVETNAYSYDGAGRLTNQTVNLEPRTYSYNFRGQMTGLVDTNSATFGYAFDGDGNRIVDNANRYVYDGPNVVLELDAQNGQPMAGYVQGPGIDQPIEWLRLQAGFPESPTRVVYHTDGLGSVVAMTRGEGGFGALVLRTYSYEAFGKVRAQSQAPFAPDNRYTFTGREALGDSAGFMYYRWRVMDPNVGGLTSQEPLLFGNSIEFYRYAMNNPMKWTDLLGLDELVIEFPVVGVGKFPAFSAELRLDISGDPSVSGLDLSPEFGVSAGKWGPGLQVDKDGVSTGWVKCYGTPGKNAGIESPFGSLHWKKTNDSIINRALREAIGFLCGSGGVAKYDRIVKAID